jgi:hypothetical protein
MRKNFSIALVPARPGWRSASTGCLSHHRRRGQDISATGHVLTNSAQKNTP